MKKVLYCFINTVCFWGLAMPAMAQNTPFDILKKVNDHWQATHPKHGNAFWHIAAYHTGNMAAYEITQDERYRAYSEAWAEKNEWKGARSDDKSKWKYRYGETDEHVLFGDWQTCFQTYIDLYNLQPDEKKIARAREVMEYEMSTPNNDYWWWADGLYMVMPVMTKLYKVTGNELYLKKMHEYFTYSKNLMYDEKECLFYRDAKYIFPKHQTKNGKKDFWSRGNGWVFAALAKVLQDLPETDIHRGEYIRIYQSMAKALRASQQSEGHWTRSLLDAQQAPGYETSGTAFFAYGLLWGINNGLLDKNEYEKPAQKAWEYLTETALQPDGTVGYVQPIGERADQHNNVNEHTTADFGVGAFLLAATEMVRFTEKENRQANNDRQYWTDLAYKIAAPVLENMSRGELSKNMPLELSPTWDGRDRRVSYMEAFGRLMDGIAPWLSLPDDDTPEGKQRKQLREWALKSYTQAVDPKSPDYLLWRNEGQPLVDAAFLASSFLRAPKQLWEPLDDITKKRYIEEFQQLRRVDPPYSNWLLFSATIETFLLSVDAQYDMYRIHSAIRKIEEWYVGDGWYSDGEHFAFDYYNSYVIQPMYVQVLEVLANKKHLSADKTLGIARKRMQRFGMILERFVSPEGTFPVFGRSMTYRLGVFQPLALLAWKENLPEELPEGQVRAALTATMKRMFSVEGNFNDKGFLQLGFAGHQPNLADRYTNNGSLYLTSEVFLPLGLPASHSFWTSPAQDWTAKKAWSGADFPKDHAIHASPANNAPLAWAGNSINVVIFRKNSLVTHGDAQFMAYYDQDGYLCLGKRKWKEEHWEIRRTQYTGNIRDAHNCISIMTDGDGYLHVAWDHHNSPLNYAISKHPLSLDLGEKQNMTGNLEDKVSYPEFHQMPGGNLLFLYREGGSGNGNLVINRYDTKSKQWTQLHDNLISGEKLRNAYWQACVDKKGVVHLSWVWRETPDVATNHDMCYARSSDGGKTWKNSLGKTCALPITAATAEYACKIPQNSELINQTSMTTDESGNPCIATYYRLPDSDIPQYHLIYLAKGKQWKDIALDFRKTPFSLSGMGTKKIPIARPQILYDQATKQWLLIFRDEERGSKISLANCPDLTKNQWQISDLTPYSVGDWEPTYDTELWNEKKILHLFVQKVQQGDGEQQTNLGAQPVSVIEFTTQTKDNPSSLH